MSSTLLPYLITDFNNILSLQQTGLVLLTIVMSIIFKMSSKVKQKPLFIFPISKINSISLHFRDYLQVLM